MFDFKDIEDGSSVAQNRIKRDSMKKNKELVKCLQRRRFCVLQRVHLRDARIAKSNDLRSFAQEVARHTQHVVAERQRKQLQSGAALQAMNMGNLLSYLFFMF